MAIYDIDYDEVGENLTSPDYRKPKFLLWIRALLYPLNWLITAFQAYRTGYIASRWGALFTYSLGRTIIYGGSVYESLIAGNIGNQPDINPDKWKVIQQYVIGLDDRVRYNSQRVLLEYALYIRFGQGLSVFHQPPTQSDIYITTTANNDLSFAIGTDASNSSAIFQSGATGAVYATDHVTPNYNFTIHIPSATYAKIAGGATEVRNFVDTYALAGITYNIVTY